MSGIQLIIEPLKLSRTEREAVAAMILALPPENSAIEPDEDEEANPSVAFGTPLPPATPAVSNVVTMPPNGNGGSELDVAGLPWDARIHASSKAKTEDGHWRKKRGLADGEFERVEAELKALMAVPAPAAAPVPPPPPSPTVAVAEPIAAAIPSVPAATASVPPPPAAIPNPIQAVTEGTREGYVALITKASAAIGAKKIAKEDLDSICTTLGVSSLPLLANRLDLVPQVSAALDALLATK